MRELNAWTFEALEPLFFQPYLILVLRAAFAGTSPARVWADSPDEPGVAALWDGHHCVYLAGQGPGAVMEDGARRALTAIAAEAEAAGVGFFKVYRSGVEWDPHIARLLPAARRRERILLRRGPRGPLPPFEPPPGIRLAPLDEALLGRSDLPGLGLVREEIGGMWPSLEKFLGYGFGVAALELGEGQETGRVVGWLTAEYLSTGMCGIGVEALPAYRGRGIASAMAVPFLRVCRAWDYTAHWDSWRDNMPSVRVAQKLGFEPVQEYHMFVTEAVRPTG